MQRHDRTHRLAADAETILRAAIAAADPDAAVERALLGDDRARTARGVRAIAIGKAAVPMARAALRHCDILSGCLVISPEHDTGTVGGCAHMHAAHPLPDASSLAAAKTVARALAATTDNDVVLMLISGGASALCALPVAGVTIDDYAVTVRALLAAGADIHALNTVRSHIDRLKGGGMARLAAPARVIGLFISDVPGDDPAVIASGPLTPASTRPSDAVAVLRRYALEDVAEGRVLAALKRTQPGPQHEAFDHVLTRIVATNGTALDGAAAEARRLGYHVLRDARTVTGEARDAAKAFVDRLAEAHHLTPGTPACLLAGGETTVTVHGDGSGGRNQEFALAAALALRARARGAPMVVGAAGTDGVDGPTDAAGAIVDSGLTDRARAAGLSAEDALRRNDSHPFLAAAGALLRTGPTGTNVMDVFVGLA